MTAFDLGSLHLITDRPDAAPAPWPATAGPGDPDEMPTGPWAPRGGNTITVNLVPCCGKLPGDYCDCLDDLDQLLTAIRRPIVFPAPVVDPALREVA